MKNKTVLKLLGTFHVCLFLIFAGHWFLSTSNTDYYSEYTTADTAEEATIEAIEASTEVAEPEPVEEPVIEVVEEPETEEAPTIEVVYFHGLEVPFDFEFNGQTRLNIRDDPSMEGNVIGKIPRHKIGTVTAVYDDEWVAVSFEGTEGYCASEWVSKALDITE